MTFITLICHNSTQQMPSRQIDRPLGLFFQEDITMGAGNYYFQAPAGDSWSKMIYVDLQPIAWSDEQ